MLEFVVKHPDGEDRIYFTDGKERQLSADLSTNARVAVVQRRIGRFALLDASQARFMGKTVMRAKKRENREKEYYSGRE